MITANNAAQPELTPAATPTGGSAYQTSAGLLGDAANAYKGVATGGVMQNINAYLNPYYEQVIDRTLGRMETDRDKGLNLIGDQAAGAGAFGGSRHGVMEGEFLSGVNQNVGDMVANLYGQNFDQASQKAIQGAMAGGQGMQGLGQDYFNIGNTIADRQAQAGSQQQNLLQMLLTGGADQYSAMIQSPNQMLSLMSALMSSDPRNQGGSVTGGSTPGLFDYLSLAAGLGAARFGAG